MKNKHFSFLLQHFINYSSYVRLCLGGFILLLSQLAKRENCDSKHQKFTY